MNKLITILVLMCGMLYAQNTGLDEIIQYSLANNPGLKSHKKNYEAQKQIPDQVSKWPDPLLGVTHWIQPLETRTGPQQNIFSISQKIPFPGKQGLLEKSSEQLAVGAGLKYEKAKRDLVFDIKNMWYDLYLQDQSLKILKEYHLLLNDFVNAAAAKYSTGSGIQSEVLKAQVEYTGIQAQLIEIERKRNSIDNKLRALSLWQQNIEPVQKLGAWQIKIKEEELIEKAFHDRQEVNEIISRQESARFKNLWAARQFLPDFTLQANYITVEDKYPQLSNSGKDAWSIMLAINLPIWQSPRKALEEQTKLQFMAEASNLNELKNNVKAEIKDLVFQQSSISKTQKLYKEELIPQAESSLKSALSAYRSGRISFLDLLDAYRMLLQFKLTFVEEQVNYHKVMAALEKAVGGQF